MIDFRLLNTNIYKDSVDSAMKLIQQQIENKQKDKQIGVQAYSAQTQRAGQEQLGEYYEGSLENEQARQAQQAMEFGKTFGLNTRKQDETERSNRVSEGLDFQKFQSEDQYRKGSLGIEAYRAEADARYKDVLGQSTQEDILNKQYARQREMQKAQAIRDSDGSFESLIKAEAQYGDPDKAMAMHRDQAAANRDILGMQGDLLKMESDQEKIDAIHKNKALGYYGSLMDAQTTPESKKNAVQQTRQGLSPMYPSLNQMNDAEVENFVKNRFIAGNKEAMRVAGTLAKTQGNTLWFQKAMAEDGPYVEGAKAQTSQPVQPKDYADEYRQSTRWKGDPYSRFQEQWKQARDATRTPEEKKAVDRQYVDYAKSTQAEAMADIKEQQKQYSKEVGILRTLSTISEQARKSAIKTGPAYKFKDAAIEIGQTLGLTEGDMRTPGLALEAFRTKSALINKPPLGSVTEKEMTQMLQTMGGGSEWNPKALIEFEKLGRRQNQKYTQYLELERKWVAAQHTLEGFAEAYERFDQAIPSTSGKRFGREGTLLFFRMAQPEDQQAAALRGNK